MLDVVANILSTSLSEVIYESMVSGMESTYVCICINKDQTSSVLVYWPETYSKYIVLNQNITHVLSNKRYRIQNKHFCSNIGWYPQQSLEQNSTQARCILNLPYSFIVVELRSTISGVNSCNQERETIMLGSGTGRKARCRFCELKMKVLLIEKAKQNTACYSCFLFLWKFQISRHCFSLYV